MVTVYIMEYERGWGSRVEGRKEFPTHEEAVIFCDKFNQHNVDDYERTKVIPNWYMVAEIVGE